MKQTMRFSGLAMALLSHVAADQQLFPDRLFQSPVLGALFVEAEDFDGDGELDVVLANYFDISVHRSAPSETFELAGSGSVTEPIVDLVVADMNADGQPDVVTVTRTVAPQNLGHVAVFLGAPGGLLTAPRVSPLAFRPNSLAVGDLNGDGHTDLAVGDATTGDSSIRVLPGNGLGTFPVALPILIGAAPTNARIADVDGDHELDLLAITGRGSTQYLSVRLARPGPFQFGLPISSGPFAGNADLLIEDLSYDGQVDAVLLRDQGVAFPGKLSIALGDGQGRFGAATLHTTYLRPGTVRSGDLDGDGLADLVVHNRAGDGPFEQLSVYHGLGSGVFAPEQRLQNLGRWGAIDVADPNRDGRADLLISVGLQGFFGVLYSGRPGALEGTGRFDGLLDGFPAGAHPAVGDLNEDGLDDLVLTLTSSFVPGQVASLLSLGDGLLSEPARVNVGYWPSHPLVTDLDLDGHLDVVAGEDNAVRWFRGSGTGSLRPRRILPSPNQSIAVGDVNGDGIPDIAAVQFGTLAIHTGSSPGAFESSMLESIEGSGAMLVEDFDDDGLDDIVYHTPNGLNLRLQQNSSSLSAPISIPCHCSFQEELTSGEFNGDGLPDIVLDGNTSSVLLSRNGVRFDVVDVSVPFFARDTLALDLNGDGRDDIAWLGYDGVLQISLGAGGGQFPTTHFYATSVLNNQSMAAGDVDGDGDVDIAVTTDSFIPENAILLNQRTRDE